MDGNFHLFISSELSQNSQYKLYIQLIQDLNQILIMIDFYRTNIFFELYEIEDIEYLCNMDINEIYKNITESYQNNQIKISISRDELTLIFKENKQLKLPERRSDEYYNELNKIFHLCNDKLEKIKLENENLKQQNISKNVKEKDILEEITKLNDLLNQNIDNEKKYQKRIDTLENEFNELKSQIDSEKNSEESTNKYKPINSKSEKEKDYNHINFNLLSKPPYFNNENPSQIYNKYEKQNQNMNLNKSQFFNTYENIAKIYQSINNIKSIIINISKK